MSAVSMYGASVLDRNDPCVAFRRRCPRRLDVDAGIVDVQQRPCGPMSVHSDRRAVGSRQALLAVADHDRSETGRDLRCAPLFRA